jgi:tellurite resistance protein
MGREILEDLTTVLLQIAIADGVATEDELSRIMAMSRKKAMELELDPPSLDTERLSDGAYASAVGRLKDTPIDLRSLLLEQAATIAAEDGKVTEDETAALKRLASGLFGDQAKTALKLVSAKGKVIRLAHQLGLKGSLDGHETEKQYLASLACMVAQ